MQVEYPWNSAQQRERTCKRNDHGGIPLSQDANDRHLATTPEGRRRARGGADHSPDAEDYAANAAPPIRAEEPTQVELFPNDDDPTQPYEQSYEQHRRQTEAPMNHVFKSRSVFARHKNCQHPLSFYSIRVARARLGSVGTKFVALDFNFDRDLPCASR